MEYTKQASYLLGIPKGRLFKQILTAFEAAGYPFECENSRSLLYRNTATNTAIIPLKSEDVLTFVDQSLCNAGILGLDIIKENDKENLIDASLKLGRCRLSIAGLPHVRLSELRYVRVATKYPKIGEDFLRKLGVAGEVIPMKSSVEVAPLLGMADCILDIIETGKTLKDNGLEEWFSLFPVASQLIKRTSCPPLPDALERILYEQIT